MTDEFFKITHRATGEVTYEPVAGRKPSAVAREMGAEYAIGMTRTVPAEYRAAHGMAAEKFEVGERVTCVKYGKRYAGTVVYVGAKGRTVAEFTTGIGTVRRAEGAEIMKAAV